MAKASVTAGNLAVLTGLATASIGVAWPTAMSGELLPLLLILLAAILVVWIAWQDFVSLTIPDGALLALALIALANRLFDPFLSLDPVLGLAIIGLDVLVAGGGVLLVREAYYRRRGHDGIGFGDVKLAAVGGLLCGLGGFAWALLSASLLGLVVALLLGPARISSGKLPFGAILAPALWIVWVLSR